MRWTLPRSSEPLSAVSTAASSFARARMPSAKRLQDRRASIAGRARPRRGTPRARPRPRRPPRARRPPPRRRGARRRSASDGEARARRQHARRRSSDRSRPRRRRPSAVPITRPPEEAFHQRQRALLRRDQVRERAIARRRGEIEALVLLAAAAERRRDVIPCQPEDPDALRGALPTRTLQVLRDQRPELRVLRPATRSASPARCATRSGAGSRSRAASRPA